MTTKKTNFRHLKLNFGKTLEALVHSGFNIESMFDVHNGESFERMALVNISRGNPILLVVTGRPKQMKEGPPSMVFLETVGVTKQFVSREDESIQYLKRLKEILVSFNGDAQ